MLSLFVLGTILTNISGYSAGKFTAITITVSRSFGLDSTLQVSASILYLVHIIEALCHSHHVILCKMSDEQKASAKSTL